MSICTVPNYKLEKLNNLFIEMTSKNCNQRCNTCYIDFPLTKKVKDFISLDKVKECLNETVSENLHCIYLTGAEPMTHPDFNSILRLCLKRCNVCICTNSSFLNEKKIRFLKKVESEGIGVNKGVNKSSDDISNQIFFKLTLAHWDELESDRVRYRGNYRQTLSALRILCRYGFNSVLSIQNYYNLDKEEIAEKFKEIFNQNNITNTDIQIITSFPVINESYTFIPSPRTDCMYGRVLSQNGVYACPFLANDYRGRVGSSFNDYSKTVNAETDFCLTCSENKDWMFTIG